jgi:hypothetical protein
LLLPPKRKKSVRRQNNPAFTRALIEEKNPSVRAMEIINALMKNTIDLKRATLILRALHIAVKTPAVEVKGQA